MAGSSNPARQPKNVFRNAFDGIIIAPPAHSLTSNDSSHLPYDVFISHHGGDVKYTVANTIYKKLEATGLRVFLDKDELKLGDFFPKILEEAIGSASIHIAVFSDNYAHSLWCLAELTFMLETRMKTGINFIPIFYHVEPSTLRWAIDGKGNYAEAFNKHQMKSRYSSEKLESWKLALHKASLYNGQIISNQGEEEKAVTNVVNRVLKRLKEVRLEVAKYPVGLHEAVRDFHEKTALQSAGPIQIVGIYGEGGVGKTTLAKELYNIKRSTFARSSFLFGVREDARRGILHEIQKRLLEDLDLKGKYVDFHNVKDGKEILKCRLRSVPMLLVLDDVDHPDQVNALLPARESLAQGTLIIATTRDLGVLKASGISTNYEMRTMNEGHAHLLFCLHAFEQPSPLVGFEDLTKMLINACHGLPLLLKVLGSMLYGKSSKDYWQSQLDKISRIRTKDIKSKLKISYDALDKQEKNMFLDVACFFNGEERSLGIEVWDGSGWNGRNGWRRLFDKCLVEVDNCDRMMMHDHLKDLGREIANEQSPYGLCCPQQTIQLGQQEAIGKGRMTDAFGDNCYPRQGKITINTSQIERSFFPRSLELKNFVGNGNFITEECSELLRELVWLRWNKFTGKKLPSWLPLKSLRVLELFDPQKLEDLWECDNVPLQLRQLVFRGAHKLKMVESIKGLKYLEVLKIYGLSELYRLPSFTGLNSLTKMELKNCSKLEKIEISKTLEELKISHCPKLNGFPNLAELISLKKFILTRCDILENVEGLESLRSLELLNINNCPELTALSSLAKLTVLKEIKLKNCYKLERIDGLERLRSLETFMINDCPKLRPCIVSRF